MTIPCAKDALAMAVPLNPVRGASHLFDDQMSDLSRTVILGVIALVIALLGRYILRRGLRKLLVRKANAFCPKCFSARIRRVIGETGNPLNFFLPVFACSVCGKRFRRGRKPPFARCPECRSSDLESVAPLTGTLPNLVRSVSGAHAYRCRKCAARFADRRPHRDSVVTPEQADAIQSPSSPQGSTNL